MINTKQYWDEKFDKTWQAEGLKQSTYFAIDGIEFIKKYLDLSGKTVVDFGCGIGVSAEHFYKAGVAKYIGIDHSSVAIEKSKQIAPEYDWICGGVDDIPACDIIFLSNVVEHLEDWEAIINELIEKCENVVVLVPFEEEVRYKSLEHINFFNETSLDFLDVSVKHHIFRSKGWGLWGWNLWFHCHFKNFFKPFVGQRPRRIGHQIGFITGV